MWADWLVFDKTIFMKCNDTLNFPLLYEMSGFIGFKRLSDIGALPQVAFLNRGFIVHSNGNYDDSELDPHRVLNTFVLMPHLSDA